MTFFARLAQQENRTARNHFATMVQKCVQHVLEIKQPRLAIEQRNHVDTEHNLHLCLRVQVVEQHVSHLTLAQFDHDAHTVLVGLVAQLGDAFDFFLFDEFRNTFDKPGLVYLVRQFINDQCLLASSFVFFDCSASANVQLASTSAISLHDAGTAIDDARSGKVGTADVFHQFIDGRFRVFHESNTRADYFAQIVRRNIGGHTHGDTRGAVDQQVGYARRQYIRNLFGAVIVRRKIDRFFFKIRQQLVSKSFHADFGVTHCSGSIAIHRTEIALTIDQWITQ